MSDGFGGGAFTVHDHRRTLESWQRETGGERSGSAVTATLQLRDASFFFLPLPPSFDHVCQDVILFWFSFSASDSLVQYQSSRSNTNGPWRAVL